MYRYIGDMYAYDYINGWAFTIGTLCILFFIGAKLKIPSIYATCLGNIASRKSEKAKNITIFIISFVELYLTSRQILSTPIFNKPFGELVGTGYNYFGALLGMPVAVFAISILLVSNPLRNADIATMVAPVHLFIVKVACYCNGCCWGIPWENGPFNRHPNHTGHQVPVQAIEAFLSLAIFIFLLVYRRKSKPGTLLPLYMILYSATRFPVEFFSAAHEKIWGPFNTYHFLCVAGVVVGLILLIFVKFFGEKIANVFDIVRNKLESKLIKKQK